MARSKASEVLHRHSSLLILLLFPSYCCCLKWVLVQAALPPGQPRLAAQHRSLRLGQPLSSSSDTE